MRSDWSPPRGCWRRCASTKRGGVKIEHARVGVRLREAAFDQVREQLIEASEGEV